MGFRDDNHDLETIPGKPSGDQERYAPKDGGEIVDGYATLDRADGGRARQGRATSIKGSLEGMEHYRPRGR